MSFSNKVLTILVESINKWHHSFSHNKRWVWRNIVNLFMTLINCTLLPCAFYWPLK